MGGGRETVLIVTDDGVLGSALDKQLSQNGYATVVTRNASMAVAAVRGVLPSLVLVDRRQRVASALRSDARLRLVPFISFQPDGIECSDDECAQDFDDGIDAVVCKQGYRELIARVRAVLRRQRLGMMPKTRFQVGGLLLDIDRHEVMVEGKPVELTPKEFKILQQLMVYPARVFSRDELLTHVWGEGCALEEHTLDVHIHSLRHKIEADPAHPRYIATVRGVGYKLRADPS